MADRHFMYKTTTATLRTGAERRGNFVPPLTRHIIHRRDILPHGPVHCSDNPDRPRGSVPHNRGVQPRWVHGRAGPDPAHTGTDRRGLPGHPFHVVVPRDRPRGGGADGPSDREGLPEAGRAGAAVDDGDGLPGGQDRHRDRGDRGREHARQGPDRRGRLVRHLRRGHRGGRPGEGGSQRGSSRAREQAATRRDSKWMVQFSRS